MPRKRRPSELLAPGEYERMLAEQGGVCAICGQRPKTRRLHVDHDHATGRIRGLLCFRCNRNLPTYADAAWLERAAQYVRVGTLYLAAFGDNGEPL